MSELSDMEASPQAQKENSGPATEARDAEERKSKQRTREPSSQAPAQGEPRAVAVARPGQTSQSEDEAEVTMSHNNPLANENSDNIPRRGSISEGQSNARARPSTAERSWIATSTRTDKRDHPEHEHARTIYTLQGHRNLESKASSVASIMGLGGMSHTMMRREDELDYCIKRMTKAEDNNRKLWDQTEKRKAQIQYLENELTEAYRKLEERESSLRKVQESGFHLLEDSEWECEPDDFFRRKLDALEKKVQKWCKTYACSSLAGSKLKEFSDGDREKLANLWKDFINIDHGLLPGGLDGQKMDAKAPSMLLSAWLAHYVTGKVLCDPLFFLDMRETEFGARISDPSSPSELRTGRCIEALLEEFVDEDLKAGHTWRAQLLRQLYPSKNFIAPGKKTILEKTRNATDIARARSYEDLIDDFIHMAQPFLKSTKDDVRHALLSVFQEAGEISFKLWTQRREFQFIDMKDLARPYHHQMVEVEAHALHNQLLDKDPRCFDNNMILLVTQPAVVAYGDSAGTDYSIRRVLKKATVWMGSTE